MEHFQKLHVDLSLIETAWRIELKVAADKVPNFLGNVFGPRVLQNLLEFPLNDSLSLNPVLVSKWIIIDHKFELPNGEFTKLLLTLMLQKRGRNRRHKHLIFAVVDGFPSYIV
jgi:hypothetical protein